MIVNHNEFALDVELIGGGTAQRPTRLVRDVALLRLGPVWAKRRRAGVLLDPTRGLLVCLLRLPCFALVVLGSAESCSVSDPVGDTRSSFTVISSSVKLVGTLEPHDGASSLGEFEASPFCIKVGVSGA